MNRKFAAKQIERSMPISFRSVLLASAATLTLAAHSPQASAQFFIDNNPAAQQPSPWTIRTTDIRKIYGNVTGSGTIILDGGNLAIANGSGVLAARITSPGFAPPECSTFPSLASNCGLSVRGGAVTITGDPLGFLDYRGYTEVRQGATLNLGGSINFVETLSVDSSGTFDISQSSAGVVSITGGLEDRNAPGTVNLGSNTLLTGGFSSGVETGAPPGGPAVFDGVIRDGGSGGGTGGGFGVHSGEQRLTGLNTYTGATTIRSGATLALYDRGDISKSSVVNVDGTFSIGNIANPDADPFGAIGATLRTTAEVRNISGGGVINLGEKTLAITDGSGTFFGQITSSCAGLPAPFNCGNIEKRGIGTLTLAGLNTFNGQARIYSGTLDVSGNIDATAVVYSGGTLSGSGYVGGLSMQGGTVSPSGGAAGSLLVGGDALFGAGGTMITHLAPGSAPTSDLLDIGGTASGLSNLRILVTPTTPGLAASTYNAGAPYTVLAAGAITDGLPTVIESAEMPALVSLSVINNPVADGNVVLGVQQLPVSSLPTNPNVVNTGDPNQATLVAAIAATAAANPSLTLANGSSVVSAVDTLTNGDLVGFTGVHAEPYSSYLTVRLEQLFHISNLALDHASGFRRMGPGTGGALANDPSVSKNIWGDAGYLDGKVDAEGGLDGFDYQLASFLVGADMFESGSFTGGLYAGYGYSQMDMKSFSSQEFDTDSFLVGAYGRYDFDSAWVLSGVLGYAYGQNSGERTNASIGQFTGGLAEADFDSSGFNAALRLHKDYGFESGWSVTPFAGLNYSYIRQDKVTETGGGDFNYNIHSATADALVGSVGVRFGKTFTVNDTLVIPVAFAQYEYDFLADNDGEHDIVVTSPLFGTFDQVGQNRGLYGLVLGAGLQVAFSPNASLGVGYAYSWRENGYEQSAGAKLAWTW